jgi:hypothetical protein
MSEFLKLGKNDFIKGLLVASLGAALGVIEPAVVTGTIFNTVVLISAGKTALVAGLAYLTKNLFTNSQGEIKSEPPK